MVQAALIWNRRRLYFFYPLRSGRSSFPSAGHRYQRPQPHPSPKRPPPSEDLYGFGIKCGFPIPPIDQSIGPRIA